MSMMLSARRFLKRAGRLGRIAAVAGAVVTLASAPVRPVVAQHACPEGLDKDYVTHIGWIEVGFVKPLIGDGRADSVEYHQPSTVLRHFRVRVHAHGAQPADWRLTFHDEQYRHTRQIMGPGDFATGSTVWSKRMPGGKAGVILQSRAGAAAPFLRINGAILVAKEAKVAYYSVQDKETLKWQCLTCPTIPEHRDLCNAERIACTKSSIVQRGLGESVGMLLAFGAKSAWTCSGFLISPELFITNWHCGGTRGQSEASYWDSDTLRNLFIDFSWDGDDLSNEYGWSGSEVAAGMNVATDKDLDYAIFRIKPLRQSIGLPPIARIDEGAAITDGASLTIIHHPLGRVKYLTESECRVSAQDHPSWFAKKPGTDFLHQCDTEGGSSGAPVFNKDGLVIGIHHSGHTVDAAGKCDGKNKAVKLRHILDHLPVELKNEIINAQR